MGAIKVIWRSYHNDVLARGYWDNALLDDIFKRGDFEHIELKNKPLPVIDENEGAVFIINGRTHVEDAEKINADIAKLSWVLFIITGDEEALFPWRDIKHPIMRVWVMLPRMNEHNDTSYKLPNGYRPDTHELLKKIGQQERTLDWVFIGQVNHPRREQCVEAIKSLDNQNGVLIETHAFGEEKIKYRDYLTQMADSKIVLCPSGIESPDSFRVYEALEAGCIPVVDAFSTKHQSPGFWHYLFGDQVPFPIVDYWDKLPALLPQLLKEYPENANLVFSWWQSIKRSLYFKLTDDVRILNG